MIIKINRKIILSLLCPCGEWDSPEHFVVELPQDDHWSRKFITFTVLFETNIFSERTPPNLSLMKEEALIVIMDACLDRGPVSVVFWYGNQYTREYKWGSMECV